MSDGSTGAALGVRNGEGLANYVADFLNFCRIEKGLAANSLEAYSLDLERYRMYFQRQNAGDLSGNHTDTVLSYLNSLYQAKLGSRSIARHLATLRNFYRFLLREGQIGLDPTENVRTPKQWQ